MKCIDYEVTARNEETGKVVTDTFTAASERAARRDFYDCYRHSRYTILEVKPEAGALGEAERAKLARIARENIPSLKGREDLEARYMDELDFFDVSVWSLEAALAAAYELGRKEATK